VERIGWRSRELGGLAVAAAVVFWFRFTIPLTVVKCVSSFLVIWCLELCFSSRGGDFCFSLLMRSNGIL